MLGNECSCVVFVLQSCAVGQFMDAEVPNYISINFKILAVLFRF
jgi:hypothetical protein